jgi:hypothetical protein
LNEPPSFSVSGGNFSTGTLINEGVADYTAAAGGQWREHRHFLYFANLSSSGTISNDGSLKYEVSYDSQFIDVHLTAVPEPAHAAILLLSSGMLFRRRRNASSGLFPNYGRLP